MQPNKSCLKMLCKKKQSSCSKVRSSSFKSPSFDGPWFDNRSSPTTYVSEVLLSTVFRAHFSFLSYIWRWNMDNFHASTHLKGPLSSRIFSPSVWRHERPFCESIVRVVVMWPVGQNHGPGSHRWSQEKLNIPASSRVQADDGLNVFQIVDLGFSSGTGCSFNGQEQGFARWDGSVKRKQINRLLLGIRVRVAMIFDPKRLVAHFKNRLLTLLCCRIQPRNGIWLVQFSTV